MNNLLAKLLLARNVAHVLHWKVKSFSQHLALGELYEALTEFADELAEQYMGMSQDTVQVDPSDQNGFPTDDAVAFMQALHDLLAELKDTVPPDDALINKYEELQAVVDKIKYKIDQLK